MKARLTGTGNKMMIARWQGVGGLGEKGEGIKKYKLVTKQSQGRRL